MESSPVHSLLPALVELAVCASRVVMKHWRFINTLEDFARVDSVGPAIEARTLEPTCVLNELGTGIDLLLEAQFFEFVTHR